MLNHEKKHKMIEEINKKRWSQKRLEGLVYLVDNFDNLQIPAKELIGGKI